MTRQKPAHHVIPIQNLFNTSKPYFLAYKVHSLLYLTGSHSPRFNSARNFKLVSNFIESDLYISDNKGSISVKGKGIPIWKKGRVKAVKKYTVEHVGGQILWYLMVLVRYTSSRCVLTRVGTRQSLIMGCMYV